MAIAMVTIYLNDDDYDIYKKHKKELNKTARDFFLKEMEKLKKR